MQINNFATFRSFLGLKAFSNLLIKLRLGMLAPFFLLTQISKLSYPFRQLVASPLISLRLVSHPLNMCYFFLPACPQFFSAA